MARQARLLGLAVLAIVVAMVVSCGTCPPAPSITSILPSSASAGGSQFLLTVNGNNFRGDSVVSWNGSFVVTTFVSGHELVATITVRDIAQPGAVPVFVFNPPEGGTTFVGTGLRSTTSCSGMDSNAVAFTVNP